ncbi:MAG TPA: DUF1501 domain-containing protein [Isosphaeraceae bacterium]|jgi:hypothetical protein|nr:DUF1501 domain-containing protein [Isosphaeraceae bacterium]
MLNLHPRPTDLREGLTRRQWLRVGFGGALAATWASGRSTAVAGQGGTTPGFGRARSCILVYLFGGPSHIDIWDMKPDAPEQVRGEFRPIATKVPGIQITEHLPRLARLADRLAIVRSMTHGDANHGSAGYTMMTGRRPKVIGEVGPTPEDFPSFGSIVGRLRPPKGALPPYVALPWLITTSTAVVPGHSGGFLGHGADPFRLAAPPGGFDFAPPELRHDGALDADRLATRRALRERLEGGAPGLGRLGDDVEAIYGRAFDLLAAPEVARAFRLDREPARVRERYGMNAFGQALLLARRLAEAGVPVVTIYWPERVEREAFNNNGVIDPVAVPAWDTHGNKVGASANFPMLKEKLLPPLDLASSALVEDLEARGLLGETLVAWTGEFGRSPRVNGDAGRDHYGDVFSLMLAGGGIRGGIVHGASDRLGAHPAADPVGPAQFAATLYHCLGIRPDAEIHDGLGRPYRLAEGAPVAALLGG